MEELKALKCTECGGHIDRATMTCRFCGVQYKLDEWSRPVVIRQLNPEMVTLMSRMDIDDRILLADDDGYTKFAIDQLSVNLAKKIADLMEVSIEENPMNCSHTVYGRIRVLKPDWRF